MIVTVPLLLGVETLVARKMAVPATDPATYCIPNMVLLIEPPPESMLHATAVL